MPDASTVTSGGESPSKPQPLYAKQEKIHSRKVSGFWRKIKDVSLWILLAVFYVTPWLRWDRGEGVPDQAILMDIDGRRGYIFNLEIWPQEVYYLTGLLILAAIGLFFSTALFGRVWCGFACFQTVFTDLFIKVERFFEGDRNARIKLDKAPWSLGKLAKRTGKHGVWLLIGFLTAYTFVLYFGDAFQVTGELLNLTAGPWVLASVGFLTFTTYLFAGMAREQVCIYMCPYARFQAAMMDEHSMIVTYEEWRGEPKGKAKPGEEFEGRGHCVDCSMCVQACPTGTDIRKGAQLSCVGCALCIDACNSVMKRFGLPENLITYDSEANQVAREKGQPLPTKLLRLRTFGYTALMLAVVGVMAWGLTTRSTVEINILRDRAPLFVRLSEGGIQNGYTFKILNMIREHRDYDFHVEGVEKATFAVIGVAPEGTSEAELQVRPDKVNTFRVLVRSPGIPSEKSSDITFVLKDRETGQVIRHESVFMGPGK